MKKIEVKSEFVYVLAIIILSLSINMMEVADYGMSMIVLLAYTISQKIPVFGQVEYIIQAILLVIFCLIVKKFKMIYLMSFVTGILYGFILDLWEKILFQNIVVTSIITRILFYVVGMLLSAFAIALFYQTYLCPQVYDFFVKGIVEKYHLPIKKVKTLFDLLFLLLALLLSGLLFQRFIGIGVGTIIMTLLNGAIINFFKNSLDYVFDFKPCFYQLSQQLI